MVSTALADDLVTLCTIASADIVLNISSDPVRIYKGPTVEELTIRIIKRSVEQRHRFLILYINMAENCGRTRQKLSSGMPIRSRLLRNH